MTAYVCCRAVQEGCHTCFCCLGTERSALLPDRVSPVIRCACSTWRRGTCLHVLDDRSDWVFGAVSTPTGQVVTSSADGRLRVWNVQTGELMHELSVDPEADPDFVHGLSIEVDTHGRILAKGHDGKRRAWDGRTGQYLGPGERGRRGLVGERVAPMDYDQVRPRVASNWCRSGTRRVSPYGQVLKRYGTIGGTRSW